MSELFLSVLNMSVTASYVIFFVILIRLLLKKFPKFIAYTLWGVVAFRLIIPFSFESIFSLMPRNTNAVPIPHDIVYQQSPQVNSGIEVVDSLVNNALPAPMVGASVNPLQIYVEIAAYIWGLGILALLVYSLVSILVLKRQLKGAQLIEENIFEANNLKTPFVLGLIDPKIYLPVGLNPSERSYILLHEQIHIHRKDHIIKVLAFLILSVYWFNPIVWIAFILMSKDMELSCDERVLKEMSEGIKKPYASSLLSLASGKHILNGSPLAFGEGSVKARIKNVLNYKKPRLWVMLVSVIVLIGVSIALLSDPANREPDLSFLNPNSMLSIIGEQEQIEIKSTDYGNTFVSGIELAKWLDQAENHWKRKNVSSPYELSPSITIHVDNDAGNEIRFFESEPTLVMTLHQNKYRYYTIPKEDYLAIAAMAGSGYPHVSSITFTEHENGNENASVTITDEKVIMRMAVLMQKGEKYRPSLLFDSTQNDIPPVSDYILINMSGDETYHSYFLYSENGKNHYIDKPYDRINKIDINTVEEIITIFTGNENKQQDQTEFDVEKNLAIIMSSPNASSNPWDYINAHEMEYENFFKFGGEDALQYMLSQFEAGKTEGLRGQIMMILCKELLGPRNNVTDDSLSPQDWYKAFHIRQEIELPNYEYDGQDTFEKLVYDTEIERHIFSDTSGGFKIVAPKVFGSYEEEDRLKIFATTYSARYKLYDNILSQIGGSIIPVAITYRKDDNGGYILEKYQQASDGSEFRSSIKEYCTMPVSGKKIKGLADEILKHYADYDDIITLQYDNLYKHLKKNGITDATLTNSWGEVEFSTSDPKYKP